MHKLAVDALNQSAGLVPSSTSVKEAIDKLEAALRLMNRLHKIAKEAEGEVVALEGTEVRD